MQCITVVAELGILNLAGSNPRISTRGVSAALNVSQPLVWKVRHVLRIRFTILPGFTTYIGVTILFPWFYSNVLIHFFTCILSTDKATCIRSDMFNCHNEQAWADEYPKLNYF
jgi:hypothetical protein